MTKREKQMFVQGMLFAIALIDEKFPYMKIMGLVVKSFEIVDGEIDELKVEAMDAIEPVMKEWVAMQTRWKE